MTELRRMQNLWRPLGCSLGAALCLVVLESSAVAAIKVACIGEHTTHSHAFPADNRDAQPEGMQEYPAQLQKLLGAEYEVRNFGDCCATVMQGYTVAETHPYVAGSNANDGVGYAESIAFLPDIVIIGSWGRHDWGLSMAAGQVFTLKAFEDGYDDLIQRYQALSSKPKIFVSLPIPILNGQGDVPDNGVKTMDVVPVVQGMATKYGLPVVDLYQPFLGHMELFKQPPDGEGEGEHVTNAGLTIIANEVFKVMQQEMNSAGAGGAGGAGGASGAGAGGGGGGAASGGTPGSAGSDPSGGTGTAGQVGMAGQAGSGIMAPSAGTNGVAPANNATDSGCGCSFVGDANAPSRALLLATALGLLLLRRRAPRAERLRAPIEEASGQIVPASSSD